MESRIYGQGKPFVCVILAFAQVCTQLIPGLRGSGGGGGGGGGALARLAGNEALGSLFPTILQAVIAAIDTTIAPAPFPVMISLCTLLLQAQSALSQSFESAVDFRAAVSAKFQAEILPRVGSLPIEIQALLICAANDIIPEVSASLAEQLQGIALGICDVASVGDATGHSAINPRLLNAATTASLNRLCGSLDALSRHHSMASGVIIQRFIASVTALQVCK